MWINRTTLISFFNRKSRELSFAAFGATSTLRSVIAKQAGHPDRNPLREGGHSDTGACQRWWSPDESLARPTFTVTLLFNDDFTDVIEQRVRVLLLLAPRLGIG